MKLNQQIANDIISFVGDNRKASSSIQSEVDSITANAALKMTRHLMAEGGDLSKDYDKALDQDARNILTLIIDKAPSDRVRNDAVSDFVKRVNRCFKKTVDKLAADMATSGKSGTLSYPNLGRSIKDKVPTTKWDTKEISFTPKKDKEGKITGAEVKSVSASKSNNSGKGTDMPAVAKTPQEIAVAVALTVKEHGLSWDDVIDELTKVATLSKGHKVAFKRKEVTPAKAEAKA